MNPLLFYTSLTSYSILMSYMISQKIDTIFIANVVIFFITALIYFKVVKFLTEVLENIFYCDEYFQISYSLEYVYVSSLIIRLIWLYCGYLGIFRLDFLWFLIVSVITIFIIIVMITYSALKNKHIKFNMVKSILMVLPMLTYILLDYWSLSM